MNESSEEKIAIREREWEFWGKKLECIFVGLLQGIEFWKNGILLETHTNTKMRDIDTRFLRSLRVWNWELRMRVLNTKSRVEMENETRFFLESCHIKRESYQPERHVPVSPPCHTVSLLGIIIQSFNWVWQFSNTYMIKFRNFKKCKNFLLLSAAKSSLQKTTVQGLG